MSELQIKPWVSMWTHPRMTIRHINEYNVRYRFFVLSTLYGWPAALQVAQSFGFSQSMPLLGILLSTLVVAPFIGMLWFYAVSGLLFWIGKWFGGVASFLSIRSAVSWSNITSLVFLVIWAGLILTFRESLFLRDFAETIINRFQAVTLLIMSSVQLVFFCWTVVLFLQSVAEVQGFSVWKAFLSLFTATLIAVVVASGLVAFLGSI